MDEVDRIEAFSEARELLPEELAPYLTRLRSRDPAAADEVESLLASRPRLGRFLEPPDERPAAFAPEGPTRGAGEGPEPEIQLGRRVGAYRLRRVLGVGGMSVVYAADRADDRFSKSVAVKLVRGNGGPELVRRIDRERRLLAQLEHPNIARLLDSGETDDGAPFIVMEQVDGPTIDRYCDRNRLDVEERLRLFATVCDAVEHARTRGIVHRDLKPSNVLVSTSGTVKLLDFGIAKALEEAGPGGPGADHTQTGAGLLSPRYASPEQVVGGRSTPATDVYALGVLLDELLTGVHPYGRATTVVQLLDAIRRSEPERPSLRALGAPSEALAARRTTAPGLQRRLRGDLDNIVGKAMHRDPSRRYASAGALAEDILRHLESRPVSARPDTLRYRFGKWVLRNRVAVSAAGIVLGVLVAAAAVSANQLLRFALFGVLVAALAAIGRLYLRADEARRTASRFRAESEREKERAFRVSEFLKEMLASIDPEVSQGEDTTLLRRVLDSAARRIDEELAGQPEVAAELHLILWRVYAGLGRSDESFRHARKSAELAELSPGSDVWFEAQVALADTRLAGRDLKGAAEVLERCAPDAPSRPIELYLEFLAVSANLKAGLGDRPGEEKTLRQGVEAARGSLAPDSPRLAGQLQRLGRHLVVNGSRAEGEPLLVEAMAILSAEADAVRVPFLRTVYILSTIWIENGRAAEAESLLRETLERVERVWGANHLETALLADVLARALEAQGDAEGAERELRRYVEITTRLHGNAHRVVGSAWHEIACFHLRHGRFHESAEEFSRAIGIYEATVGSASPLTTYARTNHAALLLETGAPARAEQLLREVLEAPAESLPTRPLFREVTTFLLGASLVDQGRPDEGRELLERHRQSLEGRLTGPSGACLYRIGESRLQRALRSDSERGGRA